MTGALATTRLGVCCFGMIDCGVVSVIRGFVLGRPRRAPALPELLNARLPPPLIDGLAEVASELLK